MKQEYIDIINDIIKICNESLETDKLSNALFCECGKKIGGPRIGLWEPIGRSDTYMIRNTLKSMFDLLTKNKQENAHAVKK